MGSVGGRMTPLPQCHDAKEFDMKVLILGGTGFIGQRIVAKLGTSPDFDLRIFSRNDSSASGANNVQHGNGQSEWVQGNALDTSQLRAALQGCDAVISCLTGNASTITGCAQALAQALQERRGVRVAHLSSMAAYGDITGDVGGGWYAQAKREAERVLQSAAQSGHTLVLVLVLLRLGCIHGPESPLWVARVAAWLESRRLGDLGATRATAGAIWCM